MIFVIVGMCVPLHARVPTSPNHHNNQGHFQDRTNNAPKQRQEDLLKDIIQDLPTSGGGLTRMFTIDYIFLEKLKKKCNM